MCGADPRAENFDFFLILFLFFTIMSFNSTSACLHLRRERVSDQCRGGGACTTI